MKQNKKKNNSIKIDPIDLQQKKGSYFFRSIIMSIAVTMIFKLTGEVISQSGMITIFTVGFLTLYLPYCIAPLRRTLSFVENGIVITEEKVIILRGIYCPSRTILRSGISDCYLKIHTKEKPANPLLGLLQRWFYATPTDLPKSLILLDKNGEQIETINAAHYSTENIEKLISTLHPKSP